MKIDTNGIKNIIFDLGGVILDIDFETAIHKFKNIGYPEFGEVLHNYSYNNFFHDFEKGLVSPEHFRLEIKKISAQKVSDGVFDEAWNSMLLDFPVKRIETIESLGKKHRVFLLSNTNKIHYDVYNKQFSKKFNRNGLESLFEKAYFSHQIGMRKPDLEIFEYVLSDSGLKAEETLFVDDFIENIEAAKKLNIKTCRIDVFKDDICNLF